MIQHSWFFKKISIGVFAFICLGLSPEISFCQKTKTTFVKRVGNVLIFKTGANHIIENGRKYMILYEEITRIPLVSLPVKKSAKYAGFVRMIKVTRDMCAAEVINLKKKYSFSTGSIMYLHQSDHLNPSILDEDADDLVFEVTERPGQMDLKEKSGQQSFFKNKVSPFSLGYRLSAGYSNFYNSLTDNMEEFFSGNDIIFPGGFETKKDSPLGIGYGISLQKLVNKYLSVSLDYNRSRTEGNMTVLPLDQDLGNILQEFKVKTTTNSNVFSFSIYFGDFGFSSFKRGVYPNNSFSLYGGIGYDYAFIDVYYKSFWKKYEGGDNLVEGSFFSKQTISGYPGVHGLAGIFYHLKPGRFFLEMRYINWFNKDIGNSIPAKVGFDVIF